jgi:hypothetical protein
LKNLLFALLLLFVSCYDSTDQSFDDNAIDCDEYHDLCSDGSGVNYRICIDEYYDTWYEINGERWDDSYEFINDNCRF